MKTGNDNIMRNMAREVQLLSHDIKTEAQKPVSEKKRKTGRIIFWTLLVVVIAVVLIGMFFAG